MSGESAPRVGGAATPLLLLFDIDGTLLTGATQAHRDALHAALRAVHGVDARNLQEPPSPAGRTDNEIARLILRSAGVPEEEIDRQADAVREECCRVFAEICEADLSHTVIPGIPQLLESLAGRREEVWLGLLTGNFEPIARRKLAAAVIGPFFDGCPGGFGSDSEDRLELPAVARARAGVAAGAARAARAARAAGAAGAARAGRVAGAARAAHSPPRGATSAAAGANGPPAAAGRSAAVTGSSAAAHPRDRTLIIGDTPRDIACARADRIRCVAVATGEFGVEELAAADAVAAHAPDVRGCLRELTGI